MAKGATGGNSVGQYRPSAMRRPGDAMTQRQSPNNSAVDTSALLGSLKDIMGDFNINEGNIEDPTAGNRATGGVTNNTMPIGGMNPYLGGMGVGGLYGANAYMSNPYSTMSSGIYNPWAMPFMGATNMPGANPAANTVNKVAENPVVKDETPAVTTPAATTPAAGPGNYLEAINRVNSKLTGPLNNDQYHELLKRTGITANQNVSAEQEEKALAMIKEFLPHMLKGTGV